MNSRANIDDIMLMMDAVDEIRHSQKSPDALMTDEGYAEARETLRGVYESQGIAVTDEMLDKGIEAFREDRFRFKRLENGFPRFLALAYVKRVSIAVGFVCLVVLSVGAGVLHNQFVTVPEQRRIAAIEKLYTVDLPNQLKRAVTVSQSAISKAPADNRDSLLEALNAAQTRAQLAITERNSKASEYVGRVEQVGKQASRLAEAAAQEELERQRLAQLKSDTSDDLEHLKLTIFAGMDYYQNEATKDAVLSHLSNAERLFTNGDFRGAGAAINRGLEFTNFVATPLTFKIVQEKGVKSGVRRTNPKHPDAKIHYLVVDALDPSGTPLPIEVENVETGEKTITSRFAVRVTAEKYEAVKQDKISDGLLDDRLVGRKDAFTSEITWLANSPGTIITRW